MNERTFVMIKPDAVARDLTEEIVNRIKRAGLRVVSMRRINMDRASAERLYSVHRGKEFFERLVEYVLSGPVVVMSVEGERAISRTRELIGATDPAKATKGTIRGDFGLSLTQNTIHASDSAESTEHELPIFFKV
jgi:nucleoside-diphosphate kinase